jgi:hypothetical protein
MYVCPRGERLSFLLNLCLALDETFVFLVLQHKYVVLALNPNTNFNII